MAKSVLYYKKVYTSLIIKEVDPLKYWRGYITAAIVLVITLALMAFAKSHTVLVDMVYPYVTRFIQTSLAGWASGTAICLWQLFVMLMIVGLIASVVIMVILKWNFIQWLGWVLAGASLLFCLHTGLYGLNSYAGPLSDDIRLTVKDGEYDVTDMVEATTYFRDMANTLATQVPRKADGTPNYPTFSELAAQAGEGFETLTYQRYYPVFAGSTLPVKELGWADMYTSMGISGVTMPLTGEAAVNPQTPVVALGFTMCHEMAHRMCIALERDANLAAFLACDANSDPIFRYSGYFMAFRYCYNALASVNTTASTAAAKQIYAGIGKELKQDLDYYREFYNTHMDDKASNVANTANDTYIKVSGDESGTKSYDEVSGLLISWYLQEIYLPAHKDDEVTFDPTDKNQVDLSDHPAIGGR